MSVFFLCLGEISPKRSWNWLIAKQIQKRGAGDSPGSYRFLRQRALRPEPSQFGTEIARSSRAAYREAAVPGPAGREEIPDQVGDDGRIAGE